ncbi:type IV secretion protein Rhs [Buttiauxella sp. A2-C1_F]|uniref:type IV secretion protein Rhs n=1 Tax=unclassified Buttiauxella TaxID=2634062 RepID=UPI001E2FE6E3|nr:MULTISPECIES: type IV secretion protein Rhs [unclassified Buttiauxella]MCE0798872.1 type IV secretion protein Rhs [Buttiauxella sp. W03-F01]MCE0844072.1 type IV secretion protein Rhs [Buttiauxella sp. A2-C1_F]
MNKSIQKGGLRLLTVGEINLASSVYGFSIHYNKVWIHLDSYLPFNLQNPQQAMSPNGEMWFLEAKYQNDFSRSPGPSFKHLFLHEMMHVWQHQRGMWVRTRGLMSWAADYTYSLDKPNLLDYGLEQQASIVSDFWLLKHYGFFGHSNLYDYRDYNPAEPIKDLIAKYEKVLGKFPG